MFLPQRETYEELVRDFAWTIPSDFNMGRAVSDEWAARAPDRICLEHFSPSGDHRRLTYGALADRSSRLSQALQSLGVARGARVAILLPQGFETVIAHVAAYKIAAVALPLALLFGSDAIAYRLADSGAEIVITNQYGREKLEAVRAALPGLRHVIVTGDAPHGALSFERLIADHKPLDSQGETGPDTPALMIYTSGTTGPPKGALHGHRVLAGHMPGIQFAHPGLGQPGDRMWTPADWAWAGGLLNCLLPALLLGVPVVSSPGQKFDPETAFRMMAEMDVRNAFIPPTALRLLRPVKDPRARYDLKLRTIGSAGEALGRETYEWARDALSITVNEFYGQTECNFVLSASAEYGVTKAGSMGKPVPGHRVAIIDGEGRILPPGVAGQVAVARPDPVMFLGYWNNEDATARKFIGDWMTTGDQGVMDEEGYFTFFGRDDDVITSSGYRIGPGEIEDCLLGHPAVRLAAAVGKPDPVRTEIVKAFVVLKDGYVPSQALEGDIRDWVKHRLSMHEYPREIAFLDALPMTTTGKVIRRALRAEA